MGNKRTNLMILIQYSLFIIHAPYLFCIFLLFSWRSSLFQEERICCPPVCAKPSKGTKFRQVHEHINMEPYFPVFLLGDLNFRVSLLRYPVPHEGSPPTEAPIFRFRGVYRLHGNSCLVPHCGYHQLHPMFRFLVFHLFTRRAADAAPSVCHVLRVHSMDLHRGTSLHRVHTTSETRLEELCYPFLEPIRHLDNPSPCCNCWNEDLHPDVKPRNRWSPLQILSERRLDHVRDSRFSSDD